MYTVDANNAGSNDHEFEKINGEYLKSNHGRLRNLPDIDSSSSRSKLQTAEDPSEDPSDQTREPVELSDEKSNTQVADHDSDSISSTSKQMMEEFRSNNSISVVTAKSIVMTLYPILVNSTNSTSMISTPSESPTFIVTQNTFLPDYNSSIIVSELPFNNSLFNLNRELEIDNPISLLATITAFPSIRHILVNRSSDTCLFPRLRNIHHDWHHDLNPENVESFEVYSVVHTNPVPKYGQFGSSSKYGSANTKPDTLSKNYSDIVERFHRALREGNPCSEPKDADTRSTSKPLILSLQALIDTYKPKLFIEYSFIPTKASQVSSASFSGEISRELSKSNSYLTSLSLEVIDSIPFKASEIDSPTDTSSCKGAANTELSTNTYFASGNLATIDSFSGQYDCAQTVPDLVGLTDMYQLLPSEFEGKLGQILCRCNYTFVYKTLPDSRYFTFWDSISSLIKAASSSASQLCDLSYESSVYTSSDFMSHVKYTHIVVRRNDTADSAGLFPPRNNYLTVDALFSLPLKRRSVENLAAAIVTYLSTKSSSSLLELGLQNSSLSPPYYNLLQLEAATDFSEIRLNAWVGNLFIRGSKILSLSEADAIDVAMAVQSVPSSSTTTSSSGSYSSSYSWRKNSRKYSSNSGTQNSSADSNTSTTANPTASPYSSSSSRSRRLSAISYSSYSKSVKEGSGSDGLLYKDGAVLSWMLSNRSFDDSGDHVDSQIQLKINKLSTKGRGGQKDLATDSKSPEDKVSFNSDVRALQKEMQDRESISFQHWMKRLSSANQLRSIKHSKIVYIFGNEISLLSIKIATLFPSTIVVSVLGSHASMQSHMSLVSLMAIRNNIITYPKLTVEKFAALLVAPERADHSILHFDFVLRVILLAVEKSGTVVGSDKQGSSGTPAMCGVDVIEESIASILLLSNVTYVELPSPVTLRVLLQKIVPTCADYIGSRYASRTAILESALQYIGFGVDATIIELHDDFGSEEEIRPTRLFKVQISFQSTSTNKDSDTGTETGNDCRQASVFYQERRSSFGVSLYSLLHLGIIASQKKQLLEMLVSLPIWYLSQVDSEVTDDLDSILPWNLFLQLDISGSKRKWSFSYHPHDEYGCLVESPSVGVKSESENAALDRLQGISTWRVIEKELGSHEADLANGRFSFVEHSSGYGYLSTRIAKKYSNATVISLEKDSSKIAHHLKIIKTLGVRNNALCKKTVADTTIYKNIYESPELLRYQYVPQSMLKDFFSSASIEEWGQTVGQILSIALTTFAYIPRAAQVSWAMHMIFGEVYSSKQSASGDDDDVDSEIQRFRYYLDAPYRSLGDIFRGETSLCQIRDDLDSENQLKSKLYLVKHPQQVYVGFEESWLLKVARTSDDGNTSILLTPMQSPEKRSRNSQALWPFVRCDIINMTRKVHHHYDYKKDGHKRTYIMEIRVNETLTQEIQARLDVVDVSSVHSFENANGNIILSRQEGIADSEGKVLIDQVHSRYEYLHPFMARIQNDTSGSDVLPADGSLDSQHGSQVIEKYSNDKFVQLPAGCHPNQHSIVSVSLYREKDDWPIPYNSIYGVTLITLLRLGLDDSLRERFFSSFMQLPLYEDMAPWNIVLMGSGLQYIDYDTKDVTFDKEVSKAYMIMTVLMNYKRTVEDFKRCGSKASTVYNLPYVSDCVGTYVDKALSCPSLSLPVPCPDGACHTSYISCLKSMSTELDGLTEIQNLITSTQKSNSNSKSAVLSDEIPGNSEMKSILGSFSEKTYMKNIFKIF